MVSIQGFLGPLNLIIEPKLQTNRLNLSHSLQCLFGCIVGKLRYSGCASLFGNKARPAQNMEIYQNRWERASRRVLSDLRQTLSEPSEGGHWSAKALLWAEDKLQWLDRFACRGEILILLCCFGRLCFIPWSRLSVIKISLRKSLTLFEFSFPQQTKSKQQPKINKEHCSFPVLYNSKSNLLTVLLVV